MTRIRLGRVIAERTYQLQTSTRARSLTVRIGQAVPDPEPGGDWMCPVEFRGAPKGRLPVGARPIHGVDALQALVLAIGYVQRELATFRRRSGNKLTWLGSADLGLPDIIGLVGVRRMFRAPSRLRVVKRGSGDVRSDSRRT